MNNIINMPIQHPITLETLAVQNGELRLALATEFKEFRAEMHAEFGTLCTEMHQGFRELRNDMVTAIENSRKWRHQKAQLALLAASVGISLLGILRG